MTQDEATSRSYEQQVYVSRAVWHQDNEHVLVVACPDPRFREARGEFIAARYGLSRYDPLIIPGGPQMVLTATPNATFVRDMVTLLDATHGFERIIGISHYDCRAYKEAFPSITERERRVRQTADLVSFIAEMHALVPNVAVDAYYSEPLGQHLRFVEVK